MCRENLYKLRHVVLDSSQKVVAHQYNLHPHLQQFLKQ
jgi:hypothetical protein